MVFFRLLSLAMCFCARSGLFQKAGAPISASIASISRCFGSTSKKPPQVAGALLDVLEVGKGFGCDHGRLPPLAGAPASQAESHSGRRRQKAARGGRAAGEASESSGSQVKAPANHFW